MGMRAEHMCSSRRAACCTIVTATLVAGCAGNGEGLDENGRPLGDGNGGSTALFTQIQDTIFTPVCTGCHVGAAAPRGLRLDAGNSFALLVNVPSSEVPSVLRVAPGNPDASYLVQKIEGTAAVGARMPLNGPPLPQASIDLVRQWIAQGAPAPASVDGESEAMRVVSTIPAADEEVPSADSILVVFSSAIDASLLGPDTLELRASGGDGSFDDGNEVAITLANTSVSAGNPTVLRLGLGGPLPPDSYQLAIRGTGAPAVADVHAHRLDGDSDGTAGGDYQATFVVTGARQ
jgi:hypothetical protein